MARRPRAVVRADSLLFFVDAHWGDSLLSPLMLPTRSSQQRSFVVATAGLGLLAATRLKAACALLAADRLQVDIVAWGAARAGLLMTNLDNTDGQQAYGEAARMALPILAISKHPAAVPSLSSNTTVKDLAHELKLLIQSTDGERVSSANSAPLLDCLRLDDGKQGWWLMELGLARVVVDLAARRLHVLRRMSLADLLRDATHPGWQGTSLSEADWLASYQPHVSASYSIESIWWRLAAQRVPVVAPPSEASIQLTAWPELDPEATDPALLIPLAYLMHGSWSMSDIVRMTSLSPTQAAQLLDIVAASGLAQQDAVVSAPVVEAGPSSLTQSLLKAARRFGLLFGARHV